jgi:patatin-like phospholipase/acyl hydrolase
MNQRIATFIEDEVSTSSFNAPGQTMASGHKSDHPVKQAEATPYFRILSIDGGGIRGIIPATILWYLEEELKQKTNNPDARLCDYFDLFAGASTGGILACTYLAPDEQNPARPKQTARESLDLYLKDGPQIFKRSITRTVKSLGGWWRQRYDAKTLELRLQEALGAETRMSDLLRPCMIPAYDVQQKQALFFKSHLAKQDKAQDFKAWEIARATSAAPTYFRPMQLQANNQKLSLVDGALFARNPALWAMLEAKSLIPKPAKAEFAHNNILMVSIGTGDCNNNFSAQDLQNKGTIGWAKPTFDIMLNARAAMVSQQLEHLFDHASFNYHRLDPCLHNADRALDNVNPDNLQALHEAGLHYVEQNKEKLDGIIDQLMM